jgi:hypothetical protein
VRWWRAGLSCDRCLEGFGACARERERERERGQEVAIPRHGNEAEKERYTQALRAKRRGMNAEACVEARTKGIVSARVSRAE